MDKLINSALKSFRSLAAPGMTGIIIKSIIITIIFLSLLVGGLIYASAVAADHWSYWRYAGYISWVASFGAIILAWFLFPGIMPLIVSFFDESIIRNIENHEYPPASPPIETSIWREFPHDLKFALKALLLNIILLPFYLIPVVNFFIFLALNGHLLGSEFYLTVARRHLPYKEAVAARKANSSLVFLGGILLVFLATIPIINLIAPFWGIAMMTHLYHLNNSPLSRSETKL